MIFWIIGTNNLILFLHLIFISNSNIRSERERIREGKIIDSFGKIYLKLMKQQIMEREKSVID